MPRKTKSIRSVTGPVRLKINGKKIGLNAFVQQFIRGTLQGMVRSLRGVKTVRTLTLRLDLPGPKK